MVHFMQDGQLNKVETLLENCKKLLLFCLCHLGQLWSRILLSFESCWPIFSSCVYGNPRWIQWNKLQHKHKMKILLNSFHMEGRVLTLWLLILHVWHVRWGKKSPLMATIHLACVIQYTVAYSKRQNAPITNWICALEGRINQFSLVSISVVHWMQYLITFVIF